MTGLGIVSSSSKILLDLVVGTDVSFFKAPVTVSLLPHAEAHVQNIEVTFGPGCRPSSPDNRT